MKFPRFDERQLLLISAFCFIVIHGFFAWATVVDADENPALSIVRIAYIVAYVSAWCFAARVLMRTFCFRGNLPETQQGSRLYNIGNIGACGPALLLILHYRMTHLVAPVVVMAGIVVLLHAAGLVWMWWSTKDLITTKADYDAMISEANQER